MHIAHFDSVLIKFDVYLIVVKNCFFFTTRTAAALCVSTKILH